MANKNATKKESKEFRLNQVFAMWQRKSKNGHTYFTGKDVDGTEIRGFYNTKKQNPKEPDIRVYHLRENGELEEEVYVSLWCNVNGNGKKYLSGKISGCRVVGFINSRATAENKQPYFSVYWSEDSKPAEGNNMAKSEKKEEPKSENGDTVELPF